MNYAPVDPIAGLYQINFVYQVDTVERVATGTIINAFDSYWGGGEFIYAKAAANVRMGGCVTLLPVLTGGKFQLQATEIATTINQSRPVAFACSTVDSGEFGWFAISGMVPASAGATAAAGAPIGIFTSAGQITGTIVAGRGILNAVAVLPPTTTVVKTGCTGRSGDFTITIPNAEGWFIGATLTGTGVGASAKVVSVSPDQRTVTVDVANSAAVTGSVTATYTGFVVVHLDRPTTTQITA